MAHANYEIVPEESRDGFLTIRDVGPWDRHQTVTNDAEHVVAELLRTGNLTPDMRLFYYDSEGELDEITFTAQGFRGFRPGPRPKPVS